MFSTNVGNVVSKNGQALTWISLPSVVFPTDESRTSCHCCYQIINSRTEESVVATEYWEDKQTGERQALCAWTIVLIIALAFQFAGLV